MSKDTNIPDAEFKEIVIGTYGPMLEAILKEFKTVKSNQQVLSKQIDSVQTTADTIKRECDMLHGRLFTLDTTSPRALVEKEHQLLSEVHTGILDENKKLKEKLVKSDKSLHRNRHCNVYNVASEQMKITYKQTAVT